MIKELCRVIDMHKALLIVLILTQVSILAKRTEVSLGKAYNKFNELIYSERHLITYKKGVMISLATDYYDLKGALFARLKSDFSKNLGLPDHHFSDQRFERHDGTLLSKDLKTVRAYGKRNKEAIEKSKNFDVLPNLISGQGLYAYIKINLNKLIKEEETDILFLVPMKRDFYRFRIRKEKVEGENAYFTVEIKNWFARLVAPSLEVIYNTKTSELLEFKGPSNILDEKERIQKVRIVYEYPKR